MKILLTCFVIIAPQLLFIAPGVAGEKVYWGVSVGQAVVSANERGGTVSAKPYILDLRLGHSTFEILSFETFLGRSLTDDELVQGNKVSIDYLFGGAASLNLPKLGFLSLFAKTSYTWVKLSSDADLAGLDSSESGIGYAFGIKTYRTRNSVGGLAYNRYLEGAGDAQIESFTLWYKHHFD